ncbi:MarR family winged helix-turn-helix transcriptional regulator [Streptomyces griseofuscus]|uniref:MarR family winged helix-turn-helix transcriptional regulator n=1 Tax=Streptomyces griseofuscus TaxID=146922 RepID=UPI0036F65028
MRLVHAIEAECRARPTSSLDLRATPSTLTSLADRLERDGYLERRHPTDRRTVVLVLTPTGKRDYAAEKSFHRHLIDDSLDASAREHVLAALAGLAQSQSADRA